MCKKFLLYKISALFHIQFCLKIFSFSIFVTLFIFDLLSLCVFECDLMIQDNKNTHYV